MKCNQSHVDISEEADFNMNAFYLGIMSSSSSQGYIKIIPDNQINSVPFPIPSSSTLQLEQ